MSKKRAYILVLVLLPLALGGAVVGTFANGSRSVESASLPEATISHAAPSDAADESAPSVGEFQAGMFSPSASALVASVAREPQVQGSRVATAPVPVQLETATPEPMLENGGPVESDIQIAALVDSGWQLRPRHYTSLGLANSIGGGGGGSADGETPPDANDSGENAALPTEPGDEHETRQPSGEPDGSSDENSGSTPGESSKYPPTNHDDTESHVTEPQDTESDDTESHEEELVEQDPIDTGGSGPIYVPHEEMKPPVVQVPEPATFGLLGLGLVGCALARRRRRAELR